MDEVVVIDGARTAFGEYCGSLKNITAIDLGAAAARAAIERSRVKPDQIGHVIFGNAMQTSGDAVYGARHVALKAGLPVDVPAVTVNSFGGSGLEALVYGARLILLGETKVCLVGGMENMSQSPHVIRGARWELPLGRGVMEDSLRVALQDSYNNMSLGLTAENLAVKYNLTRLQQDEYALRSSEAAIVALKEGRLAAEIVPVAVFDRMRGSGQFSTDECIRETSLEQLRMQKPVFKKPGVVTAGNSAGIADGAAALIIAERKTAENIGLKPAARLTAYNVCGVDPDVMGIGPVPAIRRVADDMGIVPREFDLVEINESFAAQYLACERELELNRERVNVNGGSIALGHPLAASGARLVLTIIYEMHRRQARNGVVSLSVAGGQGIAAAFERI
jgi:acetyl-CoA acyltransferase 2